MLHLPTKPQNKKYSDIIQFEHIRLDLHVTSCCEDSTHNIKFVLCFD